MSGDIGRATVEAATAAAAARGCVVVQPEPNQLFVDIDSNEDMNFLLAGLARIRARTPVEDRITPSPSGREGRWHVTLTFAERTFTPLERVAFQAALGSDRMRELNSVIDILDNDPLPTIFFEKPDGSTF